MNYAPRYYQSDGINIGIDFFRSDSNDNEFQIFPTGSGKSVVVANLCKALEGEKTLVFQPSEEILIQNYNKVVHAGLRAGIYSASAGHKFIENTTFVTIGSVITKKHLFKDVKNIIVDECHLVNAADGMYQDFFSSLPKAKILGLTATPYRLTAGFDGAKLEFINRSYPRIFTKCSYYIQNKVLFDSGHLAPLEYFNYNIIDRSMLDMNSSGSDFTDASLKSYYRAINMPQKTTEFARRILAKRRSLLVFCSLISEAKEVVNNVPGAVLLTGDTDKTERRSILARFKKGLIRCIVNVGVLTTGFDYPELEAVLIARSTMSLALYYQIIGRVMRPFTYADGTVKVGWVVDLGGNIPFFGKIETMEIQTDKKGRLSIFNNGRQLTDVSFTKN